MKKVCFILVLFVVIIATLWGNQTVKQAHIEGPGPQGVTYFDDNVSVN